MAGPHRLGRCGRPEPQRQAAGHRDDEEITDLTVLVSAIQAAARELRIPPAHSPWLPALPATLLLRDLMRDRGMTAGDGLPAFPYGLDDLPAAQEQRRRHQPGHVRAPDGGGRPAQRAVPAAADHRRLGRRHADARRRAHLRHRLRERGAAAARRPAALRRGGHPRPGRAGHPADHPARRGGQPPPGTAGARAVTPISASSAPPRGRGRGRNRAGRSCRTSWSCWTAGRASPPHLASWTAGGSPTRSPRSSARGPAPACTW